MKLGNEKEANNILKNYSQLRKKCPDFIRLHQIRLTYNALPTHNRIKFFNYTAENKNCAFCKKHVERIESTLE